MSGALDTPLEPKKTSYTNFMSVVAKIVFPVIKALSNRRIRKSCEDKTKHD